MNPGRIRMAGERILIVEDEPAVARGLEYALKRRAMRSCGRTPGRRP
jgi:DNA-binding response OmpR family regulator